MRTKIEAPYSCAFLEEFFFPDSSDWNAVITLAAAFRRFNEAYCRPCVRSSHGGTMLCMA
jgi:hypothetical protein